MPVIQKISKFDLILFDFDGLLVNTEELHYEAYRRTCRKFGFKLDWDFSKYCKAAHYDASTLKQHLFETFPRLKKLSWSEIYEVKKKLMLELLTGGNIQLMPGVSNFLKALEKLNITSCVVTHSPKAVVRQISSQIKALQSIPHWIVREDYEKPKPHPECYMKAISLYSNPHSQIIGFEDTPRGLNALLPTKVQPVLITKVYYPEISDFVSQGVWHFSSFDEFLQ